MGLEIVIGGCILIALVLLVEWVNKLRGKDTTW